MTYRQIAYGVLGVSLVGLVWTAATWLMTGLAQPMLLVLFAGLFGAACAAGAVEDPRALPEARAPETPDEWLERRLAELAEAVALEDEPDWGAYEERIDEAYREAAVRRARLPRTQDDPARQRRQQASGPDVLPTSTHARGSAVDAPMPAYGLWQVRVDPAKRPIKRWRRYPDGSR